MSELKEKMQAVMLPTEKASHLYILNDKLFYHSKSLGYKDALTVPQHLYICSNREIKEEDWCYVTLQPSICQYKKGMGLEWMRKIEASTDKSLGLPEPSKEFIQKYIEQYNAGSPIVEVMVDMVQPFKWQQIGFHPDNEDRGYTVKDGDPYPNVKPDNTITISRIVEDWDDIYGRYYQESMEGNLEDILLFHEWLKRENYLPPTKKK